MAKYLGRRSSAGSVASQFIERLEDRQLLSTSIFALTVDNRLLQFDAANPSVTSNPLPVTGLPTGTRIVGIDVRPKDGQLYGLGQDATIYRINTATGAATAIGPKFGGAFEGPGYDLDVDPVLDQIRVVTSFGNNLLVDPDTGAVVAQTSPAYVAGDPGLPGGSKMSSIGFTNNFFGATATTAYGIDTANDTLIRLGDADAAQTTAATGQLHTVGSLGGINVESAGLDVGNETGGGVIYAAANLVGQSGTRLYTIEPGTGAATLVGTIGTGLEISEIAVVGRSVQFQVSSAGVAENATSVTLTVTRLNGTGGTATVNYATQDGSAVAGTDYTASSGVLTFADGEGTKTITIPVTDNTSIDLDRTFTVALSDPSAGLALVNPSTATVTISDNETGAILIADPNRAGRQVLLVRGGTASDRITLGQSGKKVTTTINGAKKTFSNVSAVLVLGADGNDRIDLGKTKVQTFVFAGAGNDTVTGNKANSVIVGGEGNDTIKSASGSGRQILIGGAGADKITGGAKEDLIVAGATAYDLYGAANLQGLRDLSSTWAKSGSYSGKVSKVRKPNGASGALLGPTTVFNDHQKDTIDGKGATDLFFASGGDKINKKSRSEKTIVEG